MPAPQTKLSDQFSDFICFVEQINTHAARAVKSLTDLRAAAWHAAHAWVEMQRHHHNELVAHMKSYKLGIREQIDEWFGPITRLTGESAHEVLAAVARGMTLEEWQALPAWVVASNRRQRAEREQAGQQNATPASERPLPEETLSPEAQIASLRNLVREQREEIHRLRGIERDHLRLTREFALIRRRFEKLEHQTASA